MPALRKYVSAIIFAGAAAALASDRPVPRFTVNLDLAPEERWKEVAEHYVAIGYPESVGQMPAMRPELGKKWAEALRPMWDEEYEREAEGYLKYINPHVPAHLRMAPADVMVVSAMYEQDYPYFGCSAVLAATENGTVVHGRNLDYLLKVTIRNETRRWSDLTTDVTFTRGGKPLFNTVHWPFGLGVNTGVRYDGWSFGQNTRRYVPDAHTNLAALQEGGQSYSLKMRRIMETTPDFESAVQQVWTTKWAAMHFFHLAGAEPWQGAMLSVDRMRGPNSFMRRLSKDDADGWFLLQTNDDSDGPPLDMRRPKTLKRLAQASPRDVSEAWMLRQMTTYPTRNALTAFTYVVVPSTNSHSVVLQPREDESEQPAVGCFANFLPTGAFPSYDEATDRIIQPPGPDEVLPPEMLAARDHFKKRQAEGSVEL